MRSILLLLITLLRGVAGLGLFLVFMFFFNHLLGYIFGFGFKSIGHPTLEILGLEILAGAVLGGIFWLLDKSYTKISSSSFDFYLRKAMNDIIEGNDVGRALLLSSIGERLEIRKAIENRKPWVTNLKVSKSSISGADINIIDYGQNVSIEIADEKDIKISVDDTELAQIIVHLLTYHEESILSGINS